MDEDLDGILAIYNDVIATSTAVFADDPVTAEAFRARWRQRADAGFPLIVATDDTGVTGFASFGEFRAWPGYRFTVEHGVHVRADRRGRGIGKALLQELIARARQQGLHAMIAGVGADNLASIRFHEALGFEEVARLKEVGFKFGRWLDVVLLQRLLKPGNDGACTIATQAPKVPELVSTECVIAALASVAVEGRHGAHVSAPDPHERIAGPGRHRSRQ